MRQGNRNAVLWEEIGELNRKIVENEYDCNLFFKRGNAYDDLEEFKKAIQDYSKAIELNPKFYSAYNNRGNSYQISNEFEKAIQDFSKAIEINPHYSDAYYNRGRSFDDFKEIEKAIQDYSKAIELNPLFSKAYYNRGINSINLREYEKAIQDFSKAIELNPQYQKAYNNRGVAYNGLKEYEKAIQDFSKAMVIDPLYYDSYINRGLAYRELKDSEKAIQDFSKAIEINPQDTDAFINRGNSYLQLNEFEKAIYDYSKAIELNPQDSETYNNRGNIYEDLGEFEKAIQDFSKAIELNPQDYFAYVNRGNVYDDLEEYGKAIQDYTEAIELNPQLSDAFYNRGNSYETIEDHEKAVSDFSQAIILSPNYAASYYMRGLVYQQLGEHEKSSDDIKTARMLKPMIEEVLFGEAPLDSQDTSLASHAFDELGRQIFQLQKQLETKTFEDLIILQKLGHGAFGRTYLCKVQNMEGLFALKIYKSFYGPEKRKDMLKKDSIFVQYHPNLVTVLYSSENELVDTTKLPDYEELWKGDSPDRFKTPLVLMKYFPEDLEKYVSRNNKQKLSSLQVCKILQGVVSGANFLHEKMIVHRDLHPGNILIDEGLDRVSICDFGCALDLRMNHRKFIVNKKDEFMFHVYVCGSVYWKKGGLEEYLPPEIKEATKDDGIATLDYSKSDLYAIGIIGKYILHRNCDEDEGYESVRSFVDGFLERDMEKRIDFSTAVSEIRDFIGRFL